MRSAAIHAYQTAQASVISDNQVEKMAFERAIVLLKRAADNIRDFESYVSALKFNQTLWTLIQAGVCDGAIKLPAHLKTNMLNLSLFVDAQTFKALANPKADYLTPLIDINQNIAWGLSPQSDT